MSEPRASAGAVRADPEDDARRAQRRAAELLLPYEPLDALPQDPELWDEVPLDVMARFSCVPVGRRGARLLLAFAPLDDPLKVDEVEYLLNRPIDAAIAPADRVQDVLRRHRGGELLLEQASESLRLTLVAEDETEVID